MTTPTPVAFDVERTLGFLRAELPAACRALDVGCGKGHLVAGLRDAGHHATGIERDAERAGVARAAGLDVRTVDLADVAPEDDAPFDAIVCARSLHHVHPLDAAVDRLHDLLVPGGLLLLEEFFREAIDAPTATFAWAVEDLLATGGLIEQHEHDPGPTLPPLERWRERHGHHEHPLATADEMLAAVRRRFDVRRTERVPYLFYYWTGRLPQDERGVEIARMVLHLETEALGKGAIVPMGLRAVAVRRGGRSPGVTPGAPDAPDAPGAEGGSGGDGA